MVKTSVFWVVTSSDDGESVSPKRRYVLTSPYAVTTQKTNIDSTEAVRIWFFQFSHIVDTCDVSITIP